MGLKLNINKEDISTEEKAKMFLFARWVVTCYSSEEMNSSPGSWWVEQINHFTANFNQHNYADALSFIENLEDEEYVNVNFCEDCHVVVGEGERLCSNCREVDLPF